MLRNFSNNFKMEENSQLPSIPLLSGQADKSFALTDDVSNILDEPVFDIPVPGNSSMVGCVEILLNTALGSGTLMVPYCYTTGMVAAILISVLFAIIGYFALDLMIESSYYCKKYDYRGLFAHTFGKNRLWIVNVMIAIVQFGACTIYCHWNGRLISHVVNSDNIIYGTNQFWIFLTTTFLVFPLTIFRSISSLENASLLSFCFVCFLIIHAAYCFFADLSHDGFDPEHRFVSWKFSEIMISALSVNSMAFNCHINLFACLEHLKNCTVRRAKLLSIYTIGIAFILYNLFGTFSYLDLFDKIKEGSALEYYPQGNLFTQITTVGVVCVLVPSAPIVIWACRNSINNLIWGTPPTNLRWVLIGGVLCLGAELLASASDNILLFFDVVGGLFTPLLIFFMPAAFFLKNQKNAPKYKIIIAYFIAVFTIVAAAACTYKSFKELFHTIKGTN